MLVLFKKDKWTSILNTSKVRIILSGVSKLSERASIEAEYDGVNYEALIVKLHGKYHLFQRAFHSKNYLESKFSNRRAKSETVADFRARAECTTLYQSTLIEPDLGVTSVQPRSCLGLT